MAFADQVFRVLCASGGCLEQGELQRQLPGPPAAEQLARVLRDTQRFTLVRRPGEAGAAAAAGVVAVVATSPVRLCQEHGAGCEGKCGRLHLCKYHLKGFCRNQQARRECKFIHNFHSDHNLCVLKQYGLENLNSGELRQLLLQNDPSLLPEVCLHYNKGDGPYGSCTYKKICTKLHVCQYFLWGQCRFGRSCKRSHDLLKSECYEKLERQGMSSEIIEKLPSIYRNMYDIKNGNRNMYDIEDAKSSPCKERKHSCSGEASTTNDDELEQICLYHLYRSCVFKDKCVRTHFYLPYRWQISDGNTWKDLKNMEEIEKAYCNPNNFRFNNGITESGSVLSPICFLNMCCGFAKVRRLSTASSVTKPPHFILTTEWIWYWKDEHGLWQEYGRKDDDHVAATVSSDDLEKAYLAKSSPKLNFKAGRHEYELDFGGALNIQKSLRAFQLTGTNLPCLNWGSSWSSLTVLLKNTRKSRWTFNAQCPKLLLKGFVEFRTHLSGNYINGRRNKCRRAMVEGRWMNDFYFMGPVKNMLMPSANKTLTGGSVAFMGQSTAKEAILQGMHLILTTTAGKT
ncbi:protein mono-ADP-ribosyltransferase PARP12-like isoform X2 [Falco rusticolus]|uniref:protein mono-ADP-ribosyltransferase PARP12-like isoform X2 n=1 Tax=Falco rusticolus TaxID=120794 RepID=UPI0018866EF8|nr:protein mono-ADP-ribosyltransferase PARP12-like isoform X2 [Falco rusticolus]XP_055568842.1 protein mono-ADP-ribosyltransferase PARP12 isoform X2 [Falco cherrug]